MLRTPQSSHRHLADFIASSDFCGPCPVTSQLPHFFDGFHQGPKRTTYRRIHGRPNVTYRTSLCIPPPGRELIPYPNALNRPSRLTRSFCRMDM